LRVDDEWERDLSCSRAGEDGPDPPKSAKAAGRVRFSPLVEDEDAEPPKSAKAAGRAPLGFPLFELPPGTMTPKSAKAAGPSRLWPNLLICLLPFLKFLDLVPLELFPPCPTDDELISPSCFFSASSFPDLDLDFDFDFDLEFDLDFDLELDLSDSFNFDLDLDFDFELPVTNLNNAEEDDELDEED
jgi:hypothetical protein